MDFVKLNNFFVEDAKFKQLLEVASSNSDYSAHGGNSKCFTYENYAILKTNNIEGHNNNFDFVIKNLYELKQKGINVVPILGYVITRYGKPFSNGARYDSGFIIQEKANGVELFDRKLAPSFFGTATIEQKKYVLKMCDLMANAPQHQFDKWVSDYKAITDAGIKVDPSKKTNFFYDREKGFSFIDLNFITQKKLFNEVDLFNKTSHRSFISYCCLPIVQSFFANSSKELVYSKSEEKQILDSAATTFAKIYKSLIKVGVTAQDIDDAFVDQYAENNSYAGLKIYNFKSPQEILNYNNNAMSETQDM